MKKQLLATLALAVLLLGCKTKYIHVPVETIKTETEYIDRLKMDSIYVHDSIFVAHRDDTVWLEKYKYIYKNQVKKDSIFIKDSIRVEIPYPVIERVEVNILHNWQIILMALGGILIGWIACLVIRWIKK